MEDMTCDGRAGGRDGQGTYWQGNGPLRQPTQQSSHPPSAPEWRTAAIESELAVPAAYNATPTTHTTRTEHTTRTTRTHGVCGLKASHERLMSYGGPGREEAG